MNLKEAILEEMERRTKARTEQIEAKEPGSFKEGIIKTYHEGCRDMTGAVDDARFPMEIQEYVNLAMRTNDGHCTDRLNEWQQGKATLQTTPSHPFGEKGKIQSLELSQSCCKPHLSWFLAKLLNFFESHKSGDNNN